MTTEKVVFAAQSSAQDDHLVNSGERLVNLYPEIVNDAGRSKIVLRTPPGYSTSLATADEIDDSPSPVWGGPVLAVAVSEQKLYLWGEEAVSLNGALISIQSNGTVTYEGPGGSIYSDPMNGMAGGSYIVESNRDLVVLSNASLFGHTRFFYDSSADSFSDLGALGALLVPSSMAFIDQYVVYSEGTFYNPGTDHRKVEWTALNDPTTENATYVKIKEGRSDPVARVIASQGRLYVLGFKSSELWYTTGQAGADAFARVPGAVVDIGLFASTLAFDYEETLFFMSDERVIVAARGFDFQTISTQPLNDILATTAPTHMFAYEHRGHKFIVVRFGSRPAWCYDLTTGFWHERSTGAADGAWEICFAVNVFGGWHGITADGEVYAFADTNDDDGTAITRRAISRPLSIKGKAFKVPELNLYVQPNDSSYDVDLRVSKDGGRSWTSTKTVSVTSASNDGEVTFRGLGRAKLFQVEVVIDGAVDAPLEAEAVVNVT